MRFEDDLFRVADRWWGELLCFCLPFPLISGMELALDLGDQDLLDFLLEESGDLGAEQPLSEVCGGCESGRRGVGRTAFLRQWVVICKGLLKFEPCAGAE